ncbi:hypothetical protein BDR04DRAFT_1102830 [Suillus decipiens]|nr:hypothetical protein BDR04DRAFT_1102830 [Suillus decipiens]
MYTTATAIMYKMIISSAVPIFFTPTFNLPATALLIHGFKSICVLPLLEVQVHQPSPTSLGPPHSLYHPRRPRSRYIQTPLMRIARRPQT